MVLKVKPGQKRRPEELEPVLIAPCGMNCGLCMGHLREKNRCLGCRAGDEGKGKSVLTCAIRTCETARSSDSGFCTECSSMPCPRLKRLNARYRAKYRTSMLDNLQEIAEVGVEAFVESERERWACPNCGGIQCVHTEACIYCDHEWS